MKKNKLPVDHNDSDDDISVHKCVDIFTLSKYLSWLNFFITLWDIYIYTEGGMISSRTN